MHAIHADNYALQCDMTYVTALSDVIALSDVTALSNRLQLLHKAPRVKSAWCWWSCPDVAELLPIRL